jgi:hypothetical protein
MYVLHMLHGTQLTTLNVCHINIVNTHVLTLSNPTSNLVRQYDFPVLLRCQKTSDTVFVVVRPLCEPV